MNRIRLWLAIPAAWVAVTAAAAPVPERAPVSQGPVSDYLRMRDKLPTTGAPVATKVAVRNDTIEVMRQTTQYVTQTREETVKVPVQVVQQVKKPDGKVVNETITVYRDERRAVVVTVPVSVARQEAVRIKDCKLYTLSREGKLEAVDADKAVAALKGTRTVLIGNSAEVDPRHLELIKPGTLYLVTPQLPTPTDEPPRLPPPPPPPMRN